MYQPWTFIAKLNTCDFDSLSLKFISDYLNFREQKTEVGSTFRDYLNILFGVPEGPIAGSLQCLHMRYVSN